MITLVQSELVQQVPNASFGSWTIANLPQAKLVFERSRSLQLKARVSGIDLL